LSDVNFDAIANNSISGNKIYGGTISTSAAVFEGSSANAIVRITQTGSGNALVVEDSANPDSTPFVVDASGKVGVGRSSPAANLDIKGSQLGGTAGDSEDVFRIHNPDVSNNTTYRFHNYRYTNGTSHSSSELRLQRKVDVTEQGYVGLRDQAVTFGYGTTERMRIDSSGRVTMPYQPSFIAWRSGSNQSFDTSIFGLQVVFNSTYINVGNHFNTSTGLFTAPVDGLYSFSGSVYTNGSISQMWLVVNGNRASATDYVQPSSGIFCMLGATSIHLIAGDTVGLHPYAGNATIDIIQNNNHSWFKGHLLG